jgi:hypothetical protein
MVKILALKNYLNGQEVVIINQGRSFSAAPAFVFALVAMAQVSKLKDKIDELEKNIVDLKNKI